MKHPIQLAIALALSTCSLPLLASDEAAAPADGPACTGYGPQTPRDIDHKSGENPQNFPLAPSYRAMNLCNIHFHQNAEHKGRHFAVHTHDSAHGGYQCAISKKLTAAERKPTTGEICKGLKPGDTIEVHWVHSSCQVSPGKGLGACLSEQCGNPALRVETQVFTLVNDRKALNFNDFAYQGQPSKGVHQAKALPTKTGKPVVFLGSTTGPKYSEAACSPLQVTWSVRPQCAKLDINSLGEWCKQNEFAEDHAHGVRQLVTNPKLLAPIK